MNTNKSVVLVHELDVKYAIVKYADDYYWVNYFKDDPKKMGVSKEASAAHTYTGKELHLPESYTCLIEAKKDLERLILRNPSAGYAICPIKF